MKKAKISELKNRLSYYLRFVRRGQPVLVYDRDRIIARIDPVSGAGAVSAGDEESGQLSHLRPPSAALPGDWLKGRVRVSGDVVGALLAEREAGR